jgi:hypothetical protein
MGRKRGKHQGSSPVASTPLVSTPLASAPSISASSAVSLPSVSSPGPSLADQRKLEFLWRERLRLKMRIQEEECAMDRIKAEIESCRQGRSIIEQQQAKVAIFVAMSAGRSCQQERQYHYSRNLLLNREYEALEKWNAHSGQWNALQKSLQLLNAEEAAITGNGNPHP